MVAATNFLSRDANCGLIAKLNPICVGRSLKNWLPAILFYGQCQIFCHNEEITEGNLKKEKKKEIVTFGMQKLSEIETDLEANGFCFVNQGGYETKEPSRWIERTRGSKMQGQDRCQPDTCNKAT